MSKQVGFISPLNLLAMTGDFDGGDAEMIEDVPGFRRPNDERGFIHKKLLGGISKVAGVLPIPGANIISRVTSALAGGGGRGAPAPVAPQLPAHFPQSFNQQRARAGAPQVPGIPFGLQMLQGSGQLSSGGSAGPCPPPTVWDPNGGFCVAPTSPLGADRLGGGAIMGRFGAAVIPGSRISDIAVCPSGMALGKDGLCYDHLPNRDRKYPKPRRPLLTGGEMRAISVASRAATKVKSNNKRLLKLGLLPKPARRSAPARHHHHTGAT